MKTLTETTLAKLIEQSTKDGEPVLNALAWYAGEEVSRDYCRLTGQD